MSISASNYDGTENYTILTKEDVPDKTLKTLDQIKAATTNGFYVDALPIKQFLQSYDSLKARDVNVRNIPWKTIYGNVKRYKVSFNHEDYLNSTTVSGLLFTRYNLPLKFRIYFGGTGVISETQIETNSNITVTSSSTTIMFTTNKQWDSFNIMAVGNNLANIGIVTAIENW